MQFHLFQCTFCYLSFYTLYPFLYLNKDVYSCQEAFFFPIPLENISLSLRDSLFKNGISAVFCHEIVLCVCCCGYVFLYVHPCQSVYVSFPPTRIPVGLYPLWIWISLLFCLHAGISVNSCSSFLLLFLWLCLCFIYLLPFSTWLLHVFVCLPVCQYAWMHVCMRW